MSHVVKQSTAKDGAQVADFQQLLQDSVMDEIANILDRSGEQGTAFHLQLRECAHNAKEVYERLGSIFKAGTNTLERQIIISSSSELASILI
ncbi:MAG: hypothetical protein PXY39_11885 [archaeon]|nr:hypothetical protein [archaeon]